MLLTSPAFILATYLIGQGLMTDPVDNDEWPLYVSFMPDSSDVKTDCGTLYDIPGTKDGRLMAGEVIQHFGFQLKIRSSDYNTGWAKAEAIATNLDSVNNNVETVEGEDYQICNVSRVEPIVALGTEAGTKQRRLFTINFLVTVKKI